MDPVSVVSLAGNIVTFIQFSCSLVSRTSDIYRSSSGQLPGNIELDLIARQLSLLCAKIQEQRKELIHSPLSQLALLCKDVSDELALLIAKVKCSSSHATRWGSFRQALRSILQKEEVKSLSERLRDLRCQMNIEMLAVVGEQQTKVHDMLQRLLHERQPDLATRHIIPVPKSGTVKVQEEPHDREKAIKNIVNQVDNDAHHLDPNIQQSRAEDLLREISGEAPDRDAEKAKDIEDHIKHLHERLAGTENDLAAMDLNNTSDSDTPTGAAQGHRTQMIKSLCQDTMITPIPLNDEGELDPQGWFSLQEVENLKRCTVLATCLVKEHEILRSLQFESMGVREASITKAHAHTFSWILRRESRLPKLESTASYRQETFVDWLRSSDEPFWIGGKPGSGKSTLMKHILDDPRTAKNLTTWAGQTPLIIARYFFWHRGTELQRSQQGLLQSLLHTILEAAPGLAKEVCPSRMLKPFTPWTLSNLIEIFSSLGRAATVNTKFVLFIDGLDEYSGDHFDLVQLLLDLSLSPRFKLCLASRIWPCYEDAFGQHPDRCLYLQDLTRPDIEKYTRESLDTAKDMALMGEERVQFEGLIKEVVEKSKGVFLWVRLVVRSLRDGLGNGDTISILEKRLRAFPADLEPFFKSLLDSVDPTYQEIMAQTFLIALESTSLPLVIYSFLEEGPDHALNIPHKDFPYKEITRIQMRWRRRVKGRYKGLLECWEDCNAYGYSHWKVDFLHRTVRDFLQTSPMQVMLLSHTDATFNASARLCRIRLAQLKTMSIFEHSRPPHAILGEIIDLSRQLQCQTDTCDYQLLQQLMEVLIARTDFDLGNQSQFLGLMGRKGLSRFVIEWTSKNPSCVQDATGFSPLMYLLETNPTKFNCSSQDVKDPREVLLIAKCFLQAGDNPSHEISGECPWSYLFQLAVAEMEYTNTPMRLNGISWELVNECLRHGSTLVELPRTWISRLICCAIAGIKKDCQVSPLELLEKLLANGCSSVRPHTESGNISIWSEVLADINAAIKHNARREGAVNVIELCLRRGASPHDVQLQHLLEGDYFSPDEIARIKNVLGGPCVKKR